jgi:hypothetical protein
MTPRMIRQRTMRQRMILQIYDSTTNDPTANDPAVRLQAPPIQAEGPRALIISQLQFIFLAFHNLVLSFEPYTLTTENLSLLASSHASIHRPSGPSKNHDQVT